MAAQEKEIEQEPQRGGKEKDLFTWRAPARPFKRRTREFYITVVAMAAVVGLVLFVVEGFLPVVLLVSVIFLFYVLSTVPPEEIEYKITTWGIKVAQSRTDWETMGRFWMAKRFDSTLLVVETMALPGRMELVVNPKDRVKIEKQVSKYLTYEEVPPSVLDRSANWFAKKMPGR